jgi:hypothetical protein
VILKSHVSEGAAKYFYRPFREVKFPDTVFQYEFHAPPFDEHHPSHRDCQRGALKQLQADPSAADLDPFQLYRWAEGLKINGLIQPVGKDMKSDTAAVAPLSGLLRSVFLADEQISSRISAPLLLLWPLGRLPQSSA